MMQNQFELPRVMPGKAMLAVALIASVLLSACGGESLRGDGTGAADAVLDDAADTTLGKTGAISQRANGGTNKPPVISGVATASAVAGKPWSFVPVASDPEGSRLLFSIANKPTWLSFNATTGALTGTPTATDARIWSNITISVSDGRFSASLAPFAVNVNSTAVATAAISPGNATVSWVPPNTNEDASPLTDLAGYRVYFGKAANALDQIVRVTNPAATQQVINNLASGTWYFAVSALSSTGVESALSNVASKTLP